MNLANAVYALIGSSVLFYILVGLFIFLFVWEFSQKIMFRVLASCIALLTTNLFKKLLTHTCRRNFYRSFYRTRPAVSNLSSLALETWFIGLGSSILLGRIIQFYTAAVFWVGRIDVPFLSKGVSMFGYSFDVSRHFIKELLLHEAHRHPYIERLSQMYLMRFRHRERFGTKAGAVWRQVFVQMLMPWMRKHRVFSQVRNQQAIDALLAHRLMVEEETKGIAKRIEEDMKNISEQVGNIGAEATGGLMNAAGAAKGIVENLAGDFAEITGGFPKSAEVADAQNGQEDDAKEIKHPNENLGTQAAERSADTVANNISQLDFEKRLKHVGYDVGLPKPDGTNNSAEPVHRDDEQIAATAEGDVTHADLVVNVETSGAAESSAHTLHDHHLVVAEVGIISAASSVVDAAMGNLHETAVTERVDL